MKTIGKYIIKSKYSRYYIFMIIYKLIIKSKNLLKLIKNKDKPYLCFIFFQPCLFNFD